MDDAAEANAQVAREYGHDFPTAALIELFQAWRFARAGRGPGTVDFHVSTVTHPAEPRWHSTVTHVGAPE